LCVRERELGGESVTVSRSSSLIGGASRGFAPLDPTRSSVSDSSSPASARVMKMMLKMKMMDDVRAEQEVKKLQELVRKLERQNARLRTRANIAPPSPACLSGACPLPYFRTHSSADDDDNDDDDDDNDDDDEDEEEPRALLDELMLLDLETVSPSGESEETW